MIKDSGVAGVCVAAGLWLSVYALGCGGPSPPELCEQVADAASNAFARCGSDPVASRQALLDIAAAGNCNNIVSIRDEDALQNDCIPWFRTVSCATLAAGDVDSSCKAQLER